jgi:hypothetical protein
MLNKIVNDPEQIQMKILNSMDPAASKKYLETLGTYNFTPKNIIDFNITDQLRTTDTLKLMRDYGFGGSTKDLLSTLQDNGINPGETVQIKKIGDTIKFTQGDKVLEFPAKDIADAKPTLSA